MTTEPAQRPPCRIPTAADVRRRLQSMPAHRVKDLADRSGVNVETIRQIRYGRVKNPGIDTVGAFLPYLEAFEAAEQAMLTAIGGITPPAAAPPPGQPATSVG